MKKLLLIAVAFIFCGNAISQIYAPVNPTIYGTKNNRSKDLFATGIPSKDDLLTNTSDTGPQIFYYSIDSTIWAWSVQRGFFQVGGGGIGVVDDSIFVGGLIDTITFPVHPGKRGIIVPVSILDSLKHKFIDTGARMRNGYVLSFDSTNKKWIMSPNGSGAATWGSITGSLSAQTDLQTALNLKFNISDTANKWVNNVTKNATYDSFYIWKGTTHTAWKDSIGGAALAAITPTLDQVLRKGNTTRQMVIFDDSSGVAANGITFAKYKPRNYGTVYGGGTLGTQAEFIQGYGYYTGVNGDGRPNVVGLFWGYNGGFNTAIFANEASWGFRSENWYDLSGIGSTEFHFPEFLPISAPSRRLSSFYVNNYSGYTVWTTQIDSYNFLMGATDTVAATFGGTSAHFGFLGNGSLSIANKRVPTNNFTVSLLDNGVSIGITGGAVPAASNIIFGSPVFIRENATIGTNQGGAIQANVTRSGSAGLIIEQEGLTTSSFRGVAATNVSTTGTFSLITGRNLGIGGIIETVLSTSANAGVARHVFTDSDGWTWYIKFNGGTNERTLFFNFNGADSLLKIRGDNGNVFAKYNLSVGTANPTARLMLAAGAATAAKAPLKFTTASAALLTTPEAGAMEVLVDSLFYTGSSGTRYKVYPTSSGVTSVATASPITGGTITSTGIIGIDTTIVATRAYANNVIAGGGAFVALDGSTPLTGNWNMGAFNATYTKTGATSGTVYDAFLAKNTTTPSASNQMWGPAYHSEGRGWKTNATAAGQTVDHRWYTVPVEGAAAPTGNFIIDQSIAGGSYNNLVKITSTAFGTSGNGTFELVNQFRLSVIASVGTRYGNIGGAGGYFHQFMDNNFATTLAQFANTAAGGNYMTNVTDIGASTTATSTLKVTGSLALTYIAKTANYTATISDYFIDCTSNSFTITLPTAVGITGRVYIIKNSGTATTITMATTSSELIDGSAPGSITGLVPLKVISDGGGWKTF